MKSFLILLVAIIISISTGNLFSDGPKGNVVYASNQIKNVDEFDHTEKYKAESAYELAQITGKIVSAPTTNTEQFKVDFVYSTAQVTAKVMPMIPRDQRNEFAYKMAQMTTKIVSDQNLDIEKAKAEFAYEIAQITTKIITNADELVSDKRTKLPRSNMDIAGTDPKAMLLRSNADIEPKSAVKVDNTRIKQKTMLLRNNADIEPKLTIKVDNVGTDPKAIVNSGDITPETYTGLIDGLVHVGDRRNHLDNKVNFEGEIRYHYALNSGSSEWNKDSSGIRFLLGFDTKINEDWHAYGGLEGDKSLVNYNNELKLSRLYAEGKIGSSVLRVGSFGYLMAEGNIYDSDFTGFKIDFGEPLKYTLSYGKTDYTKKTYIATARYKDFDYNLEAGIYHYQVDDGIYNQNTIWNFGGNYNFSNFGVGAMALGSNLKDSKGDNKGYVLSLNYGELKTYKRGTYDLFAKYYNQPVGTYIAHGMNGIGTLMEGFKGYGVGMHYTFTKNVVGGIEYYDLTDKTSGEKGRTWWSEINWYF